MKTAELAILIQKDIESGMYVVQVEEFPAAISQGKTIEDLKTNLLDALKILKQAFRDIRKFKYNMQSNL